MKYKIINRSNSESKFRDRKGRIWTVSPKGYVIIDSMPQEPEDWDIKEMHEEEIKGEITKKIDFTKDIFEEEEPLNSDRSIQKLTALKGINIELANALLNRFDDLETIKKLTIEDLEEIAGIGKTKAKKIVEQLKSL